MPVDHCPRSFVRTFSPSGWDTIQERSQTLDQFPLSPATGVEPRDHGLPEYDAQGSADLHSILAALPLLERLTLNLPSDSESESTMDRPGERGPPSRTTSPPRYTVQPTKEMLEKYSENLDRWLAKREEERRARTDDILVQRIADTTRSIVKEEMEAAQKRDGKAPAGFTTAGPSQVHDAARQERFTVVAPDLDEDEPRAYMRASFAPRIAAPEEEGWKNTKFRPGDIRGFPISIKREPAEDDDLIELKGKAYPRNKQQNIFDHTYKPYYQPPYY